MRLAAKLAAALALACAAPGPSEAGPGVAIVIKDQAALRAAPRDSARQQAVLWQGELVEVRAERLDYLQVYDYGRERGGFVRASHLRRIDAAADEAPELLAILRYLRDAPGAEALGIGLAMAYIQAAPAEALRGDAGVEALDAIGTLADRLAQRASSGAERPKAGDARLAAQLDVATRYGIRFASYERAGRMQMCYEGEAFRRVLAMRSSPVQRARAALALTRPECADPDPGPMKRGRLVEWQAEVLDHVEPSALAGYLANRILVRRASAWAGIAYARARNGEAADAAARRALAEFGAIRKSELSEEDLPDYNDAAMRVSAVRWAAAPPIPANPGRPVVLAAGPGRPGETCVALQDARSESPVILARRCTYGIVWTASATLNREGNALAVAVQPTGSWLELWVFRKGPDGWTESVLPPAATALGIGYAELAGWVPGGKEMLVAREARGEGRYRRSFEVIRIDTLAASRQAGDPTVLGPFRRWQDPSWAAATLSVR
jgi:hypothetical protein